MIRRDYILRMIEELRRVLAGIVALKQGRRWQEVEGTVEEQFKRLVGASAPEALAFSDTELSARLMQGEATQFVRDKTLFLITLFKEAGDAAVAQDRPVQARAFYLKGLNLLLGTFAGAEPTDRPDFVPTVAVFTAALVDAPLPAQTQAMLMHHYERTGAFAKAEDALFALLDAAPDAGEAVEFGMAFYDRLRTQSDAVLAAGNLPRAELETGVAELQSRRKAPALGKDTQPD
jgi:hypothetical protein